MNRDRRVLVVAMLLGSDSSPSDAADTAADDPYAEPSFAHCPASGADGNYHRDLEKHFDRWRMQMIRAVDPCIDPNQAVTLRQIGHWPKKVTHRFIRQTWTTLNTYREWILNHRRWVWKRTDVKNRREIAVSYRNDRLVVAMRVMFVDDRILERHRRLNAPFRHRDDNQRAKEWNQMREDVCTWMIHWLTTTVAI